MLSANNEDHEAERVAGELIAHHFINKTAYKDYAILYRGNHQSRVFEKMLMQNRIPYKISGGTSFFSRPEIKDLLAYLRVLTNPMMTALSCASLIRQSVKLVRRR
ncbi:ATP-dependent DNA helicase Rep [Klebsiella michiganensis]|nr:ATP-dependent DNA helicase Rep [Klebsiella michiganensis]